MKRVILLGLFILACSGSFAQISADSLAYQQQRDKINAMLAKRTQKFGQYSESLDKHSGIFGMQTKKDIRRSNDILMDIVKTDDTIYRQLKVLLEFNAYQQIQVQNHSKEAEASNIGYMNTINKLRRQIEELKAEEANHQQQHEKTKEYFIVVLLILLASVFVLVILKGRNRG